MSAHGDSPCGMIRWTHEVDQILEYHLTKLSTKRCCDAITYREEGCNKIACICGTQWCWLCDAIIPSITLTQIVEYGISVTTMFASNSLKISSPSIPDFEGRSERFPLMIRETPDFYQEDYERCEALNADRTVKLVPRCILDFEVYMVSRGVVSKGHVHENGVHVVKYGLKLPSFAAITEGRIEITGLIRHSYDFRKVLGISVTAHTEQLLLRIREDIAKIL
jgi:hypothetical protein